MTPDQKKLAKQAAAHVARENVAVTGREPSLPKSSPLEPNCCDDTTISLAISAKRQADALERIADVLAKQTGLVELLGDELRG